MDQQEYNNLVDYLLYANIRYYDLDDPILTDQEYDRLYNQLLLYEQDNTHTIREDSPTRRTGSTTLPIFSTSNHIQRMWSLDNVYNSTDLSRWISKLSRLTTSNLTYTISPKYDGMSLNLTYNYGKLIKATTRGNGTIGEDVTVNAYQIANIPTTIPYLDKIEIRGEVVITKTKFDRINKTSSKPFLSPRNLAAGTMRQLNPTLVKDRQLDFIAWGVGYHNTSYTSLYEILLYLKQLKFDIPYLQHVTIHNVEDTYNYILTNRDNFSIPLDGVVIVVDSLAIQQELGYTQKSPRYAVAYKFPPLEVTTTIVDVIPQVGRTGSITPVAILEPTLLDGANITRATLHNYEDIVRKDIRIGDRVVLVRSGGVIPKITSVLTDRRTGIEQPIQPPTNCPSCNSTLLDNVCVNDNCIAKLKSTLRHYVGKDNKNITNIGPKLIDQLVDNKLVTCIEDLYRLTVEDLVTVLGITTKKATTIVNSISKSK